MKVQRLRLATPSRLLLLPFAIVCLHAKPGGAVAPQPDCPQVHQSRLSYVLDNKCYEFVIGVPSTWLKAQELCEERGGQLVQIKSELVQNFLAQKIEALGKDYQDRNYWIGASDRKAEGVWQWTDGTRLSYTKWFSKLPRVTCTGDGSGRMCPELADCAAMKPKQQYRWFDGQCRAPAQAFVCEYYYVSSMASTTVRPKRAEAAVRQSSSGSSRPTLSATTATNPRSPLHSAVAAAAAIAEAAITAHNGSRSPHLLPLRHLLLLGVHPPGAVRATETPPLRSGARFVSGTTSAEHFRSTVAASSATPVTTAASQMSAAGAAGVELGGRASAPDDDHDHDAAPPASRSSAAPPAIAAGSLASEMRGAGPEAVPRAPASQTIGSQSAAPSEAATAAAPSEAVTAAPSEAVTAAPSEAVTVASTAVVTDQEDRRRSGGGVTPPANVFSSARDFAKSAERHGSSSFGTSTTESGRSSTATASPSAGRDASAANDTGDRSPGGSTEDKPSPAVSSRDTTARARLRTDDGHDRPDVATQSHAVDIERNSSQSDVADDTASSPPPLAGSEAAALDGLSLTVVIVGAVCLGGGGALAAGIVLTRRRWKSGERTEPAGRKSPLKVDHCGPPRGAAAFAAQPAGAAAPRALPATSSAVTLAASAAAAAASIAAAVADQTEQLP